MLPLLFLRSTVRNTMEGEPLVLSSHLIAGTSCCWCIYLLFDVCQTHHMCFFGLPCQFPEWQDIKLPYCACFGSSPYVRMQSHLLNSRRFPSSKKLQEYCFVTHSGSISSSCADRCILRCACSAWQTRRQLQWTSCITLIARQMLLCPATLPRPSTMQSTFSRMALKMCLQTKNRFSQRSSR